MLTGLKARCDALGVPYPEMMVADNCCHVRGSAVSVMPSMKVVQDIWHLLMRMLAVILDGTRNPYRLQVAQELVDALLETRAGNGHGAVYRLHNEQVKRFKAVYEKYARIGGVWNAAAEKVYRDQLVHVEKGCTARTRSDILSDGSRIEGSHKGWNSIQRSFASGVENFVALSHDFVLRRNIRVVQKLTGTASEFGLSTHGCHHISLVNAVNRRFNDCLATHPPVAGVTIQTRPLLANIESGETFGLVPSLTTLISFDDLEPKEPIDPDDGLEALLHSDTDLTDLDALAQRLGVDPTLLLQPQPTAAEKLGPSSASTQADLTVGPAAAAPQSAPPLTPDIATSSSDHSQAVKPAITGKRPAEHSDAHSFIDIDAMDCDNNSQVLDSSPEGEPASKRVRLTQDQLINACASGTGSSSIGPIYSFFSRQAAPPEVVLPAATSTISTSTRKQTSSTSERLSTLQNSLPPPKFSPGRNKQLTRSQLLLMHHTNIDPRSLSVSSPSEFYLFMDLRAEHQWASFSMSPAKWKDATRLYNQALQSLSEKPTSQFTFVAKSVKTLMDKLNTVEAQVLRRSQTGDFVSSKGTNTFWKKHCSSVVLTKAEAVKPEPAALGSDLPNASSSTLEPGATSSTKLRKAPVCKRCNQLLYPGGQRSTLNHARDFCSDGVRKKTQAGIDDELPKWPQPAGIYDKGITFNAFALLEAIRQLYQKVLSDGLQPSDYELEEDALVDSLNQCIATDVQPGEVLFRLYKDFTPSFDTPETLFVTIHDIQYLRILCLQ
ncbi:hypothetical protein BDZ89DRAFT_1063369 [Hymenopellis radicata]|nr:hypothetical protein BDZ89DRAFT_1063369 [Hymenopellis radicata]